MSERKDILYLLCSVMGFVTTLLLVRFDILAPSLAVGLIVAFLLVLGLLIAVLQSGTIVQRAILWPLALLFGIFSALPLVSERHRWFYLGGIVLFCALGLLGIAHMLHRGTKLSLTTSHDEPPNVNEAEANPRL